MLLRVVQSGSLERVPRMTKKGFSSPGRYMKASTLSGRVFTLPFGARPFVGLVEYT